MNLLLVSPRFPWPMTHGTYLRLFALGKEFAREHSVDLVAPGASVETISFYEQAGVQVIGYADPPLDEKPPVFLSAFNHDPLLNKYLAKLLKSRSYDGVILFGAKSLQYAPLLGAIPVIADVVDDPALEWKRLIRRDWHTASGLRRCRYLFGWYRYEKAYSTYLRHAVFVSDDDAISFRKRNPGCSSITLPNGVDLDYFSPRRNETISKSVVFTGNMNHQPNLDAALFLIKSVVPEIWKMDPEVRIVIAGANTPPELSSLSSERVIVHGWVDDIRDVIAPSGVVVLPMVSGTGIKNKLLEAWAMGKPVVMTSLSCQGVDAIHRENCLLADSPETMAQGICELISSPELADKVSVAGRRYVINNHDWSVIARKYISRFTE